MDKIVSTAVDDPFRCRRCGRAKVITMDMLESTTPIELCACDETFGYSSYGWLCPRCGRSNAPWLAQCDCLVTLITSTTNTELP